MTINTTNGPRETHGDGSPLHVINTSRVVEEDMEYLDTDEVLHCVAAAGWYATFGDGREEPLAFWAVRESDRAHGVVVEYTDSGAGQPRIDANEDVAKQPGFTGYKYIGGC